VGIGLPVLAPALREELGLSLAEVGIVLSGVWIGATVTLLPWGLLADRLGERWTLASGLAAGGVGLAAAAQADGLVPLVALLALSGAAGASVNASSGRAVLAWFGAHERGLALGIRQTAIPVGGALAAVALPAIEHAGGLDAAFITLGVFYGVAALIGAAVIRDRPPSEELAETVPWSLRDVRLWFLCVAGGFYVVAQIAVIGFVVLYLHDERGWTDSEAAAVLAAIQLLAIVARIGAGAWSDRLGARVPPLRRIGLATFGALALVSAILDGPITVVVVAFVAAGTLSMAWNGLSFTAAAELAGRARAGAAIGVQQTTLGVFGLAAPVAFAAAVSATSWRTAFSLAALCPLVGWIMLGRVRV
jgi:sugar phosphate permease